MIPGSEIQGVFFYRVDQFVLVHGLIDPVPEVRNTGIPMDAGCMSQQLMDVDRVAQWIIRQVF